MSENIHLIIEAGPERGRSLTIPAAGARVGRSSKNDLVIVDPLMSRHHCRVGFKDNILCLSDLGSSNETLVNDKPIREALLHVGDRILLGDTILRVVTNTSEGSVAPEPVRGVSAGFQPEPVARHPSSLAVLLTLLLVTVVILIGLAVWQPRQSKILMASAREKVSKLLPVSTRRDASGLVTLEIDSTPQGATVILDGVAKESTPCTIEDLPAGESELEISFYGYRSFRRTVDLAAGQTESIVAVLEEVPATLDVVSIPPGARVYLDGGFKGIAPVTLVSLAPGTYLLRAEKEGFDSLSRPVALSLAQRHAEELRLVSNAGVLEVATYPHGVRVLVDGEERGITPAKDGHDGSHTSGPLKIDPVEVGERKVQLVCEGYFEKTVMVTVKEQETTLLQESLKRLFVPDTEIMSRQGVFKGVFLDEDVDGKVRLEIRPGVIKSIEAKDIISREAIKQE